MEMELFQYIKDLWNKNKQVTRKITFRKVIEVLPMFKSGIDSSTFLKYATNWFYSGFNPGYNLRYIRIFGASIELPQGWEERVRSIITHVGIRQVPKVVNGITISAIGNYSFASSDHIPVYRNLPGDYSWIESGSGNKQVVTGSEEKERYTVQLTCLKSGINMPPFIIFKGASPPTNTLL